MTLETKRLILRPLTPDDFEAVHSWASNPENTRYMAWVQNIGIATALIFTNSEELCFGMSSG